ncbi:hypothetical protein WJX81_006864 [Elliptochloris bilobata]|uniref:Uncharacterized protein n=1 Tax=Elliptochloris bilobata TaxID=381761 RepID=A0AAW1RZM5_9CHLO
MVDVKHKRCLHEGCLKRPSFNYSGETRALYCGPHRLTHMVNVDQERRLINRGELVLPDEVKERRLRQRTEHAAEMAAQAGAHAPPEAQANLAAHAGAAVVTLEPGWTPAQLAAAAAAHLQAMLPAGAANAADAGDGSLAEPDLLSVDDLRATAAAAAAGASAALGGALSSVSALMRQPRVSGEEAVLSFLRALMRQQEVEGKEAVRERVRAYGDAFTSWDEAKRLEQYNILHFDWDISGHDRAAVIARIDKALALSASAPASASQPAAPQHSLAVDTTTRDKVRAKLLAALERSSGVAGGDLPAAAAECEERCFRSSSSRTVYFQKAGNAARLAATAEGVAAEMTA